MSFSRESLNKAVSEKLADCNGAAVYHQGLFGVTQIAGVAGAAGAILIAPLAIEVAAITGVAGLALTTSASYCRQNARVIFCRCLACL